MDSWFFIVVMLNRL